MGDESGTPRDQPDAQVTGPETVDVVGDRRSVDEETLATKTQPGLHDLEPGTALGRYIVLEEVGRGGMGRVVRGYDPKLRREVALKVLSDHVGDDGETRIVREAHALAQLSHPNVLPVYDVENAGDRWFIAMEYVEGQTLQGWFHEQSRTWREVVAMFCAAGKGLAAAHEAGLVHRDFKPANVLVGRDGRVRVMDFGIARSTTEDPSDPIAASSTAGAPSSGTPQPDMSASLTATGTIMGTRAYMAPEQHLGKLVDPRTDQYAFCVALYEGLCKKRPFLASGLESLVQEKLERDLRWPPGVPHALRSVVERGLAPKPADRFPTIEKLIETLERDPGRVRRRWLGAGFLAATVAGVVTAEQVLDARRIAACEQSGATISAVWAEDAYQSMRSTFAAASTSGEDTARRMRPWLDDYARTWQAARTEACRATKVLGERSEDLRALSLECLEERRTKLATLVDVLGQADAKTVRRAVQSAADLPAIAPCMDDGWLILRVRPPESAGLRANVAKVRERIDRANALEATARYDEAAATAEQARQDSQALGWAPLQAEAMRARASVELQRGHFETAAQHEEEAFLLAGRSGHDEVASDAAASLVFVVGDRLARYEEARRWGRIAQMLNDRIGGDDLRRASLLSNFGAAHMVGGAYAEARSVLAEALAIREQMLGAEHLEVAGSLENLANLHYAEGSYTESLRGHDRALTILGRVLGPDHPRVASSVNNLAAAHYATGSLEEAYSAAMRALAIRERSLGPRHQQVAQSLSNLGALHHARGAYDEALAHHQRALSILQRSLGDHHPQIADMYHNIGSVFYLQRRHREARATLARAVAMKEQMLGPDHPSLAISLAHFGTELSTVRDFDRARTALERALGIAQRAYSADHPETAVILAQLARVYRSQGDLGAAEDAYLRALPTFERTMAHDPRTALALNGLGLTRLEQGDRRSAIQLIERALAHIEAVDGIPEDLAPIQFALARARWPSPSSRARARSLAIEARDAYAELGAAYAEELAEVAAWLRRHPTR